MIASQGMVGRYLDENNRYAVWILDPHLDKTPWFLAWPTDDVNTSCVQPLMLSFEIANLNPERQVAAGRFCGLPTDFEEASSQEEDQPRCIGRTEFSKDGETQRVSIEAAAALRLTRTQQNAARQSLHRLIMPGLTLPGRHLTRAASLKSHTRAP